MSSKLISDPQPLVQRHYRSDMDNLAPLVAGIVVARALYPHLSIWTRGSLPDERAPEDASEGDDNAGKDQWRPRAWAQRVAKGAEECIVLDDHTAPVWEIAYKATLVRLSLLSL